MFFLKRSLAALLLLLVSLGSVESANTCTGVTQGGCNPGFVTGQVPTAAQWNSFFAAKQDYLGYTPVNPAAIFGTSPIVVTLGGGGSVTVSCPTCGATSLVVGSTAITGGTTGRVLYDNSGVLGEYSVVGTAFGGTGAANLNGFILAGTTNTITVGYTNTPFNIGTISSGTVSLACANANYQYYTNNGAHTLAAQTSDCGIDILVTNGASAGSITFSGFTVGSSTGSALTTTNGNKFLISARRINGTSTYSIYALQ